MFQFINFKIINRLLYLIKLVLILLWCNLSYALDISNVTNFFKTQNNPPLELFGIKLFANVNDYFEEKITFEELDDVYEELEITFFEKTKSVNADDIVTTKNPNFDAYILYVNENLQITGISADNWNNPTQDDQDLQKCLLKKNELIIKIANLHNLNINNFKEQNYIWPPAPDDPDYDEYKNDIASSSELRFDHNGIKLVYSLSCYFISYQNESSMFIDLFTDELNNSIWGAYMVKTEKSVYQLLNKDKDLKGF